VPSVHTTNYIDTFIKVAPDSKAAEALPPPRGAVPSVAARTFAMIHDAPYRHTSDDVLFTVWADRRGLPEAERPAAREVFFSKGQPCLRCSDLGKRYGWGVHADSEGRVALVALGSHAYVQLAAGATQAGTPVKVVSAMKAGR
jgi:Family of unknown function (DUF6157)